MVYIPRTEELFETIKNNINGGNYLINWNWFKENEEIQRNIISILHMKGSDKINIHDICIGSFNEYEKQDRFINHIDSVLSNLYDDIYNYCVEKYPEIYKDEEEKEDEDEYNLFITPMKYFENHTIFVTEHIRKVLREINIRKGKFFKAVNSLWLFEFVIHNFPFIKSECQHVLKPLENACINLRKETFKNTDSITENQIIYRFKNSINCLLSLIQGDKYEYVPDTFVYKEFNKVDYLTFKLNFTTKKDFVVKYIKNDLDNVEKSNTQIVKVLYCIKILEFIIEHYDFINSDEFSVQEEARQKFIDVISTKCQEFKNTNVITNTPFEYSIYKYLIDITSFLSDKISSEIWTQSESNQKEYEDEEDEEENNLEEDLEQDIEDEEDLEEDNEEVLGQELQENTKHITTTTSTTDHYLILINLFITLCILIHEIYVWHFLK